MLPASALLLLDLVLLGLRLRRVRALLDRALLVEAEALADEALHVLLDQLAADDVSLLGQEVARGVELRGLKEDVEGRAPVARVADGLAVGVVRRLLLLVARLGLDDDGEGRAALTLEILARVLDRTVLVDSDDLEP